MKRVTHPWRLTRSATSAKLIINVSRTIHVYYLYSHIETFSIRKSVHCFWLFLDCFYQNICVSNCPNYLLSIKYYLLFLLKIICAIPQVANSLNFRKSSFLMPYILRNERVNKTERCSSSKPTHHSALPQQIKCATERNTLSHESIWDYQGWYVRSTAKQYS